MKNNNLFSLEKISIVIIAVLIISIIPLLLISGNETAAIILIVIFSAASIPVFLIFRQIKEQDTEDNEEESENKDIYGIWYSNHYMKKIYEAYNIQEEPEENSEEREEEWKNDLSEVEEKSSPYLKTEDITSISKHPNSPTFSYEAEDNELRQRAFNHLSTATAIIAVLWGSAIIYLPPEIEELRLFLESESFLSILIKIIPGVIFIFSSITSILANRLDENKGFILIYVRPIFFILISIGYIYNEISKYIVNF